ncbi:MAG TPA: universal stress protein [Leucothrix sp.]|nr:universal stress protein [Leucothrix sp.]
MESIMFKKILVPVDLSTEATTKKLCQTANDLAGKYGGEVVLMTIIPDYGMPIVASFFPEGAQKKIKQEIKAKLENIAKAYFEVPVSTMLKQGKRRQVILKVIEDSNPDLVMMGCRKKKSRSNQRLLGATGTVVSDRADCSVMIVR